MNKEMSKISIRKGPIRARELPLKEKERIDILHRMETERDVAFMLMAIRQAEQALESGEVPVGAVLAKDNQVISAAYNRPISTRDPSAHAEILAMREAGAVLGNYRLIGATLYVTIEPCIMCAGAIIQARLARIVYGAEDLKAGGVSSLYSILNDRRLNHSVEVTGGVLAKECGEILSRFFRQKRIKSPNAAS